ncbi:putative toxin-antitoxin system toxin component, PIN family [Rhodohalobacter sulfatireducens]|uniref:Toxin-antitoxin system toxin component, PIN family n=1 Tax=Rhodohalobacter sulfatireducens TaxID=2911366 RepID=A0ABS9KG62_9BACT|nr:putative toxin-antitoxin system toxin component, PIN family [Rhodohalobacter sulfatireducens]MCG2589847.1 putative toxin-antitoxin system toxin component, PIN family [Rhodohalobacter sulfatireducens]MDR9366141.1 putative toxin-antitoxin system toxin component, PIN family [Balneolaceae bacterium]
MRLILDTNLWISFLISSNYEKLDELLVNKDSKLLFSQELLEEFLTVAGRPKLKKYISDEDLAYLLETIDEVAEFVNVTSEITKCRDPKDNFLLSLAVDGKADYLLTGDNDLLVLKKIGDTRIETISDFFNEINS